MKCTVVSLVSTCVLVSLFFVTQKAAYEVRINDWSSDMCSTDVVRDRFPSCIFLQQHCRIAVCGKPDFVSLDGSDQSGRQIMMMVLVRTAVGFSKLDAMFFHLVRSEEHTSELQSLMRISYAVFCLKKKTRCNKLYDVIPITRTNLFNIRKL